jgi:TonB family protein
MHRLVSAFFLAAALATVGGQTLAGEAPFSKPEVDFKQCGDPEYPKPALKRDEEGLVILGVRVDADGTVRETKILLSAGTPILDEATIAAFRKCRYTPGTVNGQPAAMWTMVQYFWMFTPPNGRLVQRLAKAALAGDTRSRYLLGAILHVQATTDAERNKALEVERSAAEAGEPVAQAALGSMYEDGKLVPRDLTKARYWFGLAAAQGNVVAMDYLRLIGAGE